MLTFKSYIKEDLDELIYNGNDNAFALALVSEIDDQISAINTEVEIDVRPNKQTGKKIGISQLMLDKDRNKFAGLANQIIDEHPSLERATVPPGRKEKDYAFKHKDMEKYIYINCRPMGKRSSLGDDPHELMTAVLCLLPSVSIPKDSDEMDALIETVKKNLKNASGYKQTQVDSMVGDYPNLAKAVSAAISIHQNGYGNADKVYLTAQAWDNDVKQFQMTKYGMKDYNSSDFIIKKGNDYIGISLKKKTRLTETDPTLLNKAFTGLLNDKKFDKIKNSLEKDSGTFYLHVIKLGQKLKILSKELEADIAKTRPNLKNWKEFIQRVPNDLINRALKGRRTLFKQMGDTIIANKELIANQLVQLIFKSDLKELKKSNFDFALVTGVGDYGPNKGIVVEKGEYKNIDNITTKLDDLLSTGKVDIKYTEGAGQAFDLGATAAIIRFDLMIGDLPVCNIQLRYKGNFRAAPNFLATMTPEFKRFYN